MHRLQYLLLQILDSEEPESIDYIIALHILRYFSVLEGVSIQQLADACLVSKSTISRFCRKIGFEDYSEMLYEFKSRHHSLNNIDRFGIEQGTSLDFLTEVSKAVIELNETLDYDKIKMIGEGIATHKNVYLMGNVQAYNPALNLQEDLFLKNKIAFAPSLFSTQLKTLVNAKADDLFIVFSNSGNFFHRIFINHEGREALKRPTVWMVTGNSEVKEDELINHVLYIPHNDTYADHPLKFTLTANVIALAYTEYMKDHNY